MANHLLYKWTPLSDWSLCIRPNFSVHSLQTACLHSRNSRRDFLEYCASGYKLHKRNISPITTFHTKTSGLHMYFEREVSFFSFFFNGGNDQDERLLNKCCHGQSGIMEFSSLDRLNHGNSRCFDIGLENSGGVWICHLLIWLKLFFVDYCLICVIHILSHNYLDYSALKIFIFIHISSYSLYKLFEYLGNTVNV